jgi:diguanylate cyclase (GGDEF)-like protein
MAAANSDRARIEVPGVGWCETVAVPVYRQARTRLLLARAGDRFSEKEVGLLAGVAQVLALGFRLVGTVAVERRQADENRDLIASLRERQALEERLARIAHQISSRAPLQQVMDAITSRAAQLLGVDMVALRLVDESDANLMIVVSSFGVPDGLSDELHRLAMGIAEPAVAENRLDAFEGHRDGDDTAGLLADVGVRSAMAAPVRVEGAPTGALVVGSAGDGRVYSQHERDILAAFAEHASLVLNDARTVQALSQALGQATHQSLHDELTGLPNRACFYDRTDQALRHAARDHTSTAVLLFDLDRFKQINDTLGHKLGDRVLAEVGPRIRRAIRDADTLARLGGDEFGVLVPGVEDLRAAVQVAERVNASLEEPFDIDGVALSVGASCGVAIAPADGDSADLLLQRSDVAMYVAKDSHANLVVYNDALNVNTPARLALLGELRTAIAHEQLVLNYQPKAHLASGRIQGVGALIRWRHPTLGLVRPDQFIPLAENTGLIKPLTTWVLNAALSQLRQWQDQIDNPPTGLSMAVNVSTRNLLDDAFPAEVIAALYRWKLPARLLELEITESAIMADPTRANRLLNELAGAGVKLSIDDFGTGYSSLAYLKNLPVSQLKIDQSFVQHMHHDLNDAIIVQSVIDLGHNLGLHTVAEGIEDHDTWQQLASLCCDSAQGYYLAKPMPAEHFHTWLRHTRTPPGQPTSLAQGAPTL